MTQTLKQFVDDCRGAFGWACFFARISWDLRGSNVARSQRESGFVRKGPRS